MAFDPLEKLQRYIDRRRIKRDARSSEVAKVRKELGLDDNQPLGPKRNVGPASRVLVAVAALAVGASTGYQTGKQEERDLYDDAEPDRGNHRVDDSPPVGTRMVLTDTRWSSGGGTALIYNSTADVSNSSFETSVTAGEAGDNRIILTIRPNDMTQVTAINASVGGVTLVTRDFRRVRTSEGWAYSAEVDTSDLSLALLHKGSVTVGLADRSPAVATFDIDTLRTSDSLVRTTVGDQGGMSIGS